MFCQAICPLNFPMGTSWELTNTQTAKTSRNDGKTRRIRSKDNCEALIISAFLTVLFPATTQCSAFRIGGHDLTLSEPCMLQKL